MTGFGDWAGSSANPSKAVAEVLDGETVGGATIGTVIVPNIFDERRVRSYCPEAHAHPRGLDSSSGAACHRLIGNQSGYAQHVGGNPG